MNRIRPGTHSRPGPPLPVPRRLATALLALGLMAPAAAIGMQQRETASGTATVPASMTVTMAEVQQEQQAPGGLLQQRIDALEDSLRIAQMTMESGRKRLAFIRQQLRGLMDELDKMEDQEGYERLRAQLLRIQSGLMASSLIARIEVPPLALEDPGAPDAPDWRRYFPNMDELPNARVRNDIFMIGKDVEVGIFEKVRGDVVVIGGKVTVSGSVGGNVFAVGDNIEVTHTGRIGGDAITLGGRIIQEPGGYVEGDWIDTSSFWPSHLVLFNRSPLAWFIISVTAVVFALIAAMITGLVAPRNVDRIERQVRTRFGSSFLIGLMTEVLLPVVIVLLMITIVGIPVAVILVPILMIGLLLLGFTGVAKAVGRSAGQRGLRLGQSPMAAIAVGVLLLESIYFVSRALGFTGDLLDPLAFVGRLLGGLVLFVAWTTGLGAALLTRFGTRTPGEQLPPTPATPPVGGEEEAAPAT